MDTTTTAIDAVNTGMNTGMDTGAPSACAAKPAAQRRPALTWERSHASTRVPTTGGVRPDAAAARLRGALAPAVRGSEQGYAVFAPRTTVPSSGTTTTSPPV